ncbi:MAG: hypothetical protein WBG01_15015 [Bacteroidota bacterium]
MNPMTTPCSHHDIRSALIPMVKPVNPRRKMIIYFVTAGSVDSGLELAKSIQTTPKANPQIVAIKTRFVVSISAPP